MGFPRVPPGFLRDVVAVDRGALVDVRSMATSAVCMVVPVAAGLALGEPHLGFVACLGASLLGAPSLSSRNAKGRLGQAMSGVSPTLLAVGAAALIGGKPWGDGAVIALVAGAGLLTSYSRPVAVAAIRFGICLVLCLSLFSSAPAAEGHSVSAWAFAAGTLFAAALGVLWPGRGAVAVADARPAITPRARRIRFLRTLRTIGGWQFPLRLALGLGLASGIRHLWPAHHFYWIMLTVVVLTAPAIEPVPLKTAQRLAGTLAGVAIAAALRAGLSSSVWLGLAACVLAAILPAARSASYLLYSSVVTPLILLALDTGAPKTHGLFLDRLTATFAAGAIVLVLNTTFDRIGVGNPGSTP